MKRVRAIIKKAGWAVGLDLKADKTSPRVSERFALKDILGKLNIGLVIDVGANIGQYGLMLRGIGYSKKIISFEPVEAAFKSLAKTAEKDGNWVAVNKAIGDKDTTANMHVTNADVSSTLMETNAGFEESDDNLRTAKSQIVTVARLDKELAGEGLLGENVLLKIDVQGFERQVLLGAAESLSKIGVVEIEMSTAEIYKGQMLIDEAIAFLRSKGFVLFNLFQVYYEPQTFQLLQVDGIFIKEGLNGAFGGRR